MIETSHVEQLCADRPEDRTEIFAPNSWYGIAHTIRSYCGWPQTRPLPFVVPHGVEVLSTKVWRAEQLAWLPAVYSFPAYRDAAYQSQTSKAVIAGCSPWLYLPATAALTRAAGPIVVMPAHSSHHVHAELNHEQFAEIILERYPGSEIQCCLYWRDVQLGHHKTYVRKGFKIVSAGHMFDPLFMTRLAGIFANARLVVSNAFGSHIFYAAAAGVPVILTQTDNVEWTAPQAVRERDYHVGETAETFRSIEPLFLSDHPNVEQQRRAAELMLGKERMLSPADLKALLDGLAATAGIRLRAMLPWPLRQAAARAASVLTRVSENRDR